MRRSSYLQLSINLWTFKAFYPTTRITICTSPTYYTCMHCCTIRRRWWVPPSLSVWGCVPPPPWTTPTSNTKFLPRRPLFDTRRRLFTCCRHTSGTVRCQRGAGTNNSGKQRNTEEGIKICTLRRNPTKITMPSSWHHLVTEHAQMPHTLQHDHTALIQTILYTCLASYPGPSHIFN